MRIPYGTLVAVCVALGIELDLIPRWHAERADRLLDESHAQLVDALGSRYAAAGWEVAVEASFAIDGEHGSVDVVGFHPPTGLVAVNEVKSVVPDAQAMLRALDRKTRHALVIARDRGWHGSRVARFLVVGEDRTARRRIERFGAMFEAAYPLHGRGAIAWIDDPKKQIEAERAGGSAPRLVSGLFFLSPVRHVGVQPQHGGRFRVRHPRAA